MSSKEPRPGYQVARNKDAYKTEKPTAPHDFPGALFGETIGDLIDLHVKLNTAHRSYLAAGMLATLCSAIAGKFYLRSEVTDRLGVKMNVGGKVERGLTIGSQFIAVIGASSDGKSSGLSTFIEPLKDIDRQLYELYKTRLRLYGDLKAIKDDAEREKKAAQLAQTFRQLHPTIIDANDGYDFTRRPELSRYFIDDFTLASVKPILVSNRRANIALCAYKDEMKGFFEQTKRGAAELGTTAQLCTLWSGGDWLTQRKDKTDSGQFISGTEDVRNPAFCFVGGLQLGLLKAFINDENIDQGFVGRFLIFAPGDVRTLARKKISQDDRAALETKTAAWREIIRQLHEATPRVFTLDDAATKRHEVYEASQAFKLNAYRDAKDIRATLLSKHIELMPRLALAIHAAKTFTRSQAAIKAEAGAPELWAEKANVITKETLEAAIRLTAFFEAEINAIISQAERSKLKAIPDDALVFLFNLVRGLQDSGVVSFKRSDYVAKKETFGALEASGIGKDRFDRLLEKPFLFSRLPGAPGAYQVAISADELEAEISERPSIKSNADTDADADAKAAEAAARNAEMNKTLAQRPPSLVPDGNGGYIKATPIISLKP
jgi:hypothetical protein